MAVDDSNGRRGGDGDGGGGGGGGGSGSGHEAAGSGGRSGGGSSGSGGEAGGGLDGEVGHGNGSDDDEDYLMHMLDEAQGRREAHAAMCSRVDAEVERRMETGVRIHPDFRALANRREAEERARCPQGHAMVRCDAGAAGLACDGGCGQLIKRGSSWMCCEACDHDVCMGCVIGGSTTLAGAV